MADDLNPFKALTPAEFAGLSDVNAGGTGVVSVYGDYPVTGLRKTTTTTVDFGPIVSKPAPAQPDPEAPPPEPITESPAQVNIDTSSLVKKMMPEILRRIPKNQMVKSGGVQWANQEGTSLIQPSGASINIGGSTMAFTTVSVDVTRPADTTAYAANDAISDSTSSPTSGGFTLADVVDASGKSGLITDIIITSSNPAGGLFGELWVFDTSVTNINDNAAFAISDSEIKTVVDIIPFTTVADTNNSQATIPNRNVGFTSVGSANLRFLIKAKAAYTPISAEVLTVRAKCLQVN